MKNSLKTMLTVSGLGMAMAVAPAIAQAPAPQSTAPAATTAAPAATTNTVVSASALESAGSWRASKLIGLDVYNQSNEKLGDINELIMDKDGKVSAVIIGVGGFLGVGERDIAVSLGQLRFVEEARSAATASTTTTRPATAPAATPRDSMASSATPAAKTTATTTTTTPVYDWVPDHAVMNATKDQLNAMAEFKYTAK